MCVAGKSGHLRAQCFGEITSLRLPAIGICRRQHQSGVEVIGCAGLYLSKGIRSRTARLRLGIGVLSVCSEIETGLLAACGRGLHHVAVNIVATRLDYGSGLIQSGRVGIGFDLRDVAAKVGLWSVCARCGWRDPNGSARAGRATAAMRLPVARYGADGCEGVELVAVLDHARSVLQRYPVVRVFGAGDSCGAIACINNYYLRQVKDVPVGVTE